MIGHRSDRLATAALAALLSLSGGALPAAMTAAAAATPALGPPPGSAAELARQLHEQRRAGCDSLLAVNLQEASHLYRAGNERGLRTLAAGWEEDCAGFAGAPHRTALTLLLAAADHEVDRQVDYWTIARMQQWRTTAPAPGSTPTPDDATFRTAIADLAGRLLAAGDLSRSGEFVARFYAGEADLADLGDRRYGGTQLRKRYLDRRADQATGHTAALFDLALGGDFATVDVLDFIAVTRVRGNRLLHEAVFLRTISFVGQLDRETSEGNHPWPFTLTPAVTGASWLLAKLTTRAFLDEDLPLSLSPLRYFWFAPNSRLDLGLGGKNWLTLSTQTDFVLLGWADAERGILFNPRLGFARASGLPPREWSSICLSIGPQYWWSFEEGSGWHGWAVGLSLATFGN